MEEIDLKELLIYLKNNIYIILVIIILVCLGGCFYCLFIQTPLYKSYTTIILSGEENTNNSITQTELTLNQDLVDTYTEVVKSRKILSSVITELDLNLTYEQLNEKIDVTSLNDTEIIKITVSDENPVLAKNIANVTAYYFSKEVVSLYKLDNVNILDEAIEATSPYNINLIKQFIIYFLVGLILSLGILFIKFYFDCTVKSSEDLEKKLDLPILGVIEYYSKGGK